MPPSPRKCDQRGVALAAVLLLLAGLVAIATAVVTLSAAQRRTVQRAEDAQQHKNLLDAALRVALVEIAFAKPDGPFWHPRQPRLVKIGGEQVEVILERDAGRIDLNTADQRYLVAALVGAGMSEAEARAAAARIRDWTDADGETRPDGAEQEAYRQAGLGYEPRNAPMETTEEVRQVLGIHDLADEALQAFTVYPQQREPSPRDAPPVVTRALAWLNKSAGEGAAHGPVETAALPDSRQPMSYAGSVVRLRACHEQGESRWCRETVQRATGNAQRPFQALHWR